MTIEELKQTVILCACSAPNGDTPEISAALATAARLAQFAILATAAATAIGTLFGKFYHAVALRVAHPIAKDGSHLLLLGGPNSLLQHRRKACAVEDIVPQH